MTGLTISGLRFALAHPSNSFVEASERKGNRTNPQASEGCETSKIAQQHAGQRLGELQLASSRLALIQ